MINALQRRLTFYLTISSAGLLFFAAQATPAQGVTIRIDETPSGRSVILPFVPNPGEIFLCQRLKINIIGTNTCVNNVASDEVQFSNVGGNFAVLFSDVDEGAPGEAGNVDTGFPFTEDSCNFNCLSELNPTAYLPFPNNAGGNPAFDRSTPAKTIEYDIFSDLDAVPEPNALPLISSSLVSVVWFISRWGRRGGRPRLGL